MKHHSGLGLPSHTTHAANSAAKSQTDTQQETGAIASVPLQEHSEPETLSKSNTLLTAALHYAARGWAVLPLHTPKHGCCSCSRAGCTSVGKHPRTKNGLKDATTDPVQGREWWTHWPDANIGILTGAESGLLVLDLDYEDGKRGSHALAQLESRYPELSATLTATTGSGEHRLFNHPGVPVPNSGGKLGDGIDIRAERGYIVAAPSLHANGKRYAWVNPTQPLADVPDWLLRKMIANKETNERVPNNETHNPLTDAEPVYDGQRNDTLFKLGSALRGQHGMEHEEIISSLLQFNAAKCVPPLEEAEVLRIADSVCNRYPAETKPMKQPEKETSLRWFKLDTQEFLTNPKIALMSDVQMGWYIWLMIYAYNNCGFIFANRSELSRLAHAKSQKVFQRDCEPVLAQFVKVTGANGELLLKHEKLAAEYASAVQSIANKKAAGRAAAEKKAQERERTKASRGSPEERRAGCAIYKSRGSSQCGGASMRCGELLPVALQQARNGRRVIPLHTSHNGVCSCGRMDCIAPGGHRRHVRRAGLNKQRTLDKSGTRDAPAHIAGFTVHSVEGIHLRRRKPVQRRHNRSGDIPQGMLSD